MATLHSISLGALQTWLNVSRSPPSLPILGWLSLIQSDQEQHSPRRARRSAGQPGWGVPFGRSVGLGEPRPLGPAVPIITKGCSVGSEALS